MKQSDYNEIAKIINIQLKDMETLNESLRKFVSAPVKVIALQLANYFENEELARLPNKNMHLFKKEQFLNNCGVKNDRT